MSKIDKLTVQCLQTITTIVPTDPIDVICVSDLPNWTWGNAGTPPHPGATTWFVILDIHYKTRLHDFLANDYKYNDFQVWFTNDPKIQ